MRNKVLEQYTADYIEKIHLLETTYLNEKA
jgi:hypothetical protein